MKYIILVAIMLSACSGWYETKYVYRAESAIILNKEHHEYIGRGGSSHTYTVYLYNGHKADWYECNESFFTSVNRGDTLCATVIFIKVRDEEPEAEDPGVDYKKKTIPTPVHSIANCSSPGEDIRPVHPHHYKKTGCRIGAHRP